MSSAIDDDADCSSITGLSESGGSSLASSGRKRKAYESGHRFRAWQFHLKIRADLRHGTTAVEKAKLLKHLEPWQCSISYVKHTIFVYYDIDSILTRYRTSKNDVRYRDTILNSISKLKYSISMHYDIEETSISNLFFIDIDSLRYRRNVDIEPFYIDIDSSRYRRNVDIEVQNFDIGIYRYRTFSRYR
jgi:hypothetical protein